MHKKQKGFFETLPFQHFLLKNHVYSEFNIKIRFYSSGQNWLSYAILRVSMSKIRLWTIFYYVIIFKASFGPPWCCLFRLCQPYTLVGHGRWSYHWMGQKCRVKFKWSHETKAPCLFQKSSGAKSYKTKLGKKLDFRLSKRPYLKLKTNSQS